MRITLQKVRPVAGTPIDCTPFLDETQRQTITIELERTAFRRVHSDLRFVLSDLSDDFTNYFGALSRNDLSEVCVYDDAEVRRFWGHVDPESVVFKRRDKWVEFDAFAASKRFWELAKITKLWHWDLAGFSGTFLETMTLTTVLGTQAAYTPIQDGGTTFSSINLWDFAGELVRGYGDSTTYGNVGRFQDLSPDTTLAEYLEALALFFNAEFFVDPSDMALKMVRRGSVLNDTKTDLDAILCDDEEIEVQMLDSKTCDYIYSYASVEPEAPTFIRYEPAGDSVGGRVGLSAGIHVWVVTFVIDGVESIRSQRLEYNVPESQSKVWLNLPIGPPGTTARKLYRKDVNDTTGTFRFNQKISDNTTAVTFDNVGVVVLYYGSPLPEIDSACGAWYAFNEATNAWASPILDIPVNKNAPEGVVLDISPQLRFTEPGRSDIVRDYSPLEVYKHFLKNFNIAEAETRNRWVDVFRTRRIIKAKVKGVAFDIGDSFVSAKDIFPNDFTADRRMILRSAEEEIMSDTSVLRLMTI